VSAAGRNPRGGQGRDFFETPAWCTEVLLSRVHLPHCVLDAGCGTLAIAKVLNNHGHAVNAYDTEPPPASPGICSRAGDFLVQDLSDQSAVVMNPPYKMAAEFVRKALDAVEVGGVVCALLRLNFLGSSTKRIDLVGPDSALERVIVMARRPSFTGDGKTDATDYAWFVWRRGIEMWGIRSQARLEVVPR